MHNDCLSKCCSSAIGFNDSSMMVSVTKQVAIATPNTLPGDVSIAAYILHEINCNG